MKKLLSTLMITGLVCGATHAAKRPNILFAVADDMSHASAYGYKFLSTPTFDSVAKDGVLFTRMYTPSSKCAPSRAVMITGRNPWQLEGAANHKPVWPKKFKSVVESLTDSGYFTGFTGKGWNPGIHPKGRLLTGTHYNDIKMKKLPTRAIYKSDYTANFKEFLADKPKDKPFFFWYGCKEPHRGYEYKSGVKKAGKSFDDLDFLPTFWGTSDEAKHDILDYALEVEYFDMHFGQILKLIEEAGELENTLIIATSDNGMPFPRYKGHPHEFATRVPFAVKWPGKIKNPGRKCNKFTSFIDIAPTFLQAAGVSHAKSGMQTIEGKSLFDVFSNNVKGRNTVLTGRERNDVCRPGALSYPVRSYHKGKFVYMHNFRPERWPCGTLESGYRDTDWGQAKAYIMKNMQGTKAYELCFGKRPQEELYNVDADPECLNNLALNPEYDAKKQEMKKQLFAELKVQKDPHMFGNGEIFDNYRKERAKEYAGVVAKANKGKKKNKKNKKK